jgi:hypothetical protein
MAKTTKRKRVRPSDKPASLQGQERDRALLRRQVRLSKDIARLGRQLIAALNRQDQSLLAMMRHVGDELGYAVLEKLPQLPAEK